MSINLKTVRCTIAAILCLIMLLASPLCCFEAYADEPDTATESVQVID